jgi:hemerythrin-like domain-containing protein
MILGILSEEHEKDEQLTAGLVEELRIITAKGELAHPDRFQTLAAAFVDSLRRHLAWEDATVLKLARTWLTPEDLLEVGREMTERRGVPFPD